ncbi:MULTISPECIES: tripartite tricarboxylate transporter TctB family protein [unclassified Halomonas]|uniref:tripartite tricarboxylate transporter TctB family protein n=1 Tax=unclassified Halomonas TaxID=2609666 RepID=UPI002096D77F|nr:MULTISPECIES: tripartite tricarboxylate transporter TctB family protein [unclassified Halomonas]MCJ8284482.1 tripartite tricarboxylate transporter TctB family protein [Halomonas sp.]MCO7216202.1 tripartite tricarboxylate transporter TctB family protein [Halomonas sp. OfavH-34-E]NQY69536.1 tripartite tricarboxylate transporter TctB family protein [Halomonas sp.]
MNDEHPSDTQEFEVVKPGEKVFDWLLLLFSLAFLYEAYRIDGIPSLNSPGSFPIGLGLIMLASSVVILVSHRRKRRPQELGSAGDELKAFVGEHFKAHIVVFSLIAITYLFAIAWISFYVSTFIFLALMFIYFRGGKVVSSLIISGVSIAIIYALFTLVFRVYLP